MSDSVNVQFADKHFLSINLFNGTVYIHLTNWNARHQRKSISMTLDVFNQLLTDAPQYVQQAENIALTMDELPDIPPIPEIDTPDEIQHASTPLLMPPPPTPTTTPDIGMTSIPTTPMKQTGRVTPMFGKATTIRSMPYVRGNNSAQK
ncbi:uncharacterized protein LOC124256323 [Haliotis rubra]|uniref:uncharacterized protein LOC124256323 n=1 Tax=Haliotis rubra TaxID=36100 RepID=UPI001EE5AEF2|nr:uncharacterized protein LOC124256323 [Haliotis rubra]